MGMGEAPVTAAIAAGLQQARSEGLRYYHEPVFVAFNIVLTALQVQPNQGVILDPDSDFIWYATFGTQTGIYEVRFRLPDGRYDCNSRIRNANRVGTGNFPLPQTVPTLYAAGALIGVDIADLSNAGNTVQIIFAGLRRFKTGIQG